jgi:hypothetical protein
MKRPILILAHLAVVPLLFALPLMAQSVSVPYAPWASPDMIYTPEIHIGSATEPSTITVPPVEELIPNISATEISRAAPAGTALMARRNFDYVVSPLEQDVPGSMEDTSLSLGNYARQLRAGKQETLSTTASRAIANSADPK